MNLYPSVESPEFSKFGEVFHATQDRFQVVAARPDAAGWQAGLLKVVDPVAPALHRHPNTDECFAPLEGESVLLVAPPDKPSKWQCFRLDKPVFVRQGVWHVILSPVPPALVFICESADVVGEGYDLDVTAAPFEDC